MTGRTEALAERRAGRFARLEGKVCARGRRRAALLSTGDAVQVNSACARSLRVRKQEPVAERSKVKHSYLDFLG